MFRSRSDCLFPTTLPSGVRALALSNISSAMRRIYSEREALAKTLNDTSGLVQNVGVMIAFLLGRAVQPFSSKTCFESNYGFRA